MNHILDGNFKGAKIITERSALVRPNNFLTHTPTPISSKSINCSFSNTQKRLLCPISCDADTPDSISLDAHSIAISYFGGKPWWQTSISKANIF